MRISVFLFLPLSLNQPTHANRLAESKPDWRWQLTASGRFAHRAEYVKDAGTAHGFDIVHYEPMDGFRFEKGIEVRGHLFVMKKLAVEGTSPDGKDEL